MSKNYLGPTGAERSPGHELPGVPAEEALAERALPPHQVDHGASPEAVLELALISRNTEIGFAPLQCFHC